MSGDGLQIVISQTYHFCFRFGRKKALYLALIGQLALTVGVSFASDFYSFGILQFFVGGTVHGAFLTIAVIGWLALVYFSRIQYSDILKAHMLPITFGYYILIYTVKCQIQLEYNQSRCKTTASAALHHTLVLV